MAKKAEAYVDTSALIALADRSDTHHPLFRQLFSDPPALATTSLVVAEGHAWFLKRYDRFLAMRFMLMIEDMTPLKVFAVGRAEITGGTELMRRFSDQDLTLTDAVGLHHIVERNLRHCWSTDFHLGLSGAALAVHQ